MTEETAAYPPAAGQFSPNEYLMTSKEYPVELSLGYFFYLHDCELDEVHSTTKLIRPFAPKYDTVGVQW